MHVLHLLQSNWGREFQFPNIALCAKLFIEYGNWSELSYLFVDAIDLTVDVGPALSLRLPMTEDLFLVQTTKSGGELLFWKPLTIIRQ